MKLLGNTLLIAAGLFALAAIWITENWWQLLATSLVLFFAAASILGQRRPAQNSCPGCRRSYNTGAVHYCRNEEAL